MNAFVIVFIFLKFVGVITRVEDFYDFIFV